MANTTKYQKTPKSKAELIAEARIRQQHKKKLKLLKRQNRNKEYLY